VIDVKISVKSLKQRFQVCEPNYIKKVCHGRCCEGSAGLMVTIHETEKARFEEMGIAVENGFIKDTCGVCPLKADDLCTVHEEKPFGCKASPFTLNKNGTLIIRNRYRLLRCYNTPDSIHAYEAHRWSLVQIFGEEEVNRLVAAIRAGETTFTAKITELKYKMLVDNDHAKRNVADKSD